ncbi:MAG: hypothetical protein UY74_C0006G0015 [Candidatus Kaiserbacteria bacterium GW2011_GWC2_52_8b]|uniref:DUF3467 domain-containing protein n=2 Tax=Candidatus Kaiseribacteriota TaxID=1752734 RepID=A0A0G1XLP4_9BACT|nr:MAG: hypothetical protein UY67_C0034G0016 [Candidatus Kaiserbacteria bacterium GW2011_GWA2_52_12]KKW31816.1 MAG: hypothetical protein UY74_C0006G0015 [Candidatus Kaiserbacteria bacterium GW2011_GWC2_52_8b]
MLNMDLNKVPKQFCENITVAFSQEFFIMGMLTGENGVLYALTPQHMKRLQQYLTHQIGEYEKQFGAIQALWTPGVHSPIQTNDLKGDSSKS